MVQDYDGATVVDATGEEIGTVARSYVDDAGRVRMVSVKLGRLFAKHRLVPVDAAGHEDDRLRIPCTKQMVEDSPDVKVEETLEGEALARVRAYYAGTSERVQGGAEAEAEAEDGRRPEPSGPAVREREAAAPEGRRAEAGDASGTADDVREMTRIRDRGDVIEVPIVREELVKRPVVKEVLRIRKDAATEQRQVDEELRREDVQVEREGDADVRVEDQRRS